jgi:hypothetical protein
MISERSGWEPATLALRLSNSRVSGTIVSENKNWPLLHE